LFSTDSPGGSQLIIVSDEGKMMTSAGESVENKDGGDTDAAIVDGSASKSSLKADGVVKKLRHLTLE